jgi:anti-sigma factor RsiW
MASSCHELRQRLELLVDLELDQETAARLEAHLRGCSGCSRAYEEAVSLPFRLRALEAPEPPPALVPAVMRAVTTPAGLARRAVWTRPMIWAPLVAEGGLAGIIGLYLSGLAGVAALTRATAEDLGALWGWGVGSSSPPSDFSADLVVVVGALLLMVVTIYHLTVLVRQRAQERGRQT